MGKLLQLFAIQSRDMTCQISKFRVEFKLMKNKSCANLLSWLRFRYGGNKKCLELRVSRSLFQVTSENKIYASICNLCDLNSHRDDLKCLIRNSGQNSEHLDLVGENISVSQNLNKEVPLVSMAEYFTYVGDWYELSDVLKVQLKNGTKASISENGLIHVECGQSIESVIESLTFMNCCIDDHLYLLAGESRVIRVSSMLC